MLTYTALRDKIEALLIDLGNTNFSTAELDYFISDALREVSLAIPYLVMATLTIESRTGSATSTSSGNLVDASESQFVSGDVGKIVYNKTDKTWAVITTFTSATTVALSKDIMASGEDYAIFNKNCTQNNQINISDINDYIDIRRLEYPKGVPRNWEINGDILTIKVTAVDDSKVVSSGTQPDTEVYIWFNKKHKVTQLTDTVGAVDLIAGYAAGATSMVVDALQATGTIEADQEFTIANTRGIYRVTADATIAANEATISFYPGLESAVVDDTVVTFKQSTLTPALEPLICELAAALAALSEPMNLYQQAEAAITAIALTTTAIAAVAAFITQANTDMTSGRTEAAKVSAILDTANIELDKIGARLTQATTDAAAGRTEADKVPAIVTTAATAIGLVAARIVQALTDIASGRTAIALGVTAIASANTQMGLTDAQVDLAVTALSSGNSILNTVPVGGGAPEYMGQASSDVGVARGFMASGQGYLQVAQTDGGIANADFAEAAQEINAGMARIREAQASLEQAGTDMAANRTYIDQSISQLRLGQGYLQEGQGYMQEGQNRLATNASYLGTARGQISAAQAKTQEGLASLQKVASQLQVVRAGQVMEAYARNNLRDVRQRISRLIPNQYRTSAVFSRA